MWPRRRRGWRPCPTGSRSNAPAGLSVAYGTTLHAYRQRARLQAGETVAVLGASGGVGLAAVEIGRGDGRAGDRLRVLARKGRASRSGTGAAEGIDYSAQDLREGLRRLAPQGVDVVYDPVGGSQTEIGLRALRDGRPVSSGRFRLGRNPAPAAQSGPGEGRGHPWRRMGQVRDARTRRQSRQTCRRSPRGRWRASSARISTRCMKSATSRALSPKSPSGAFRARFF